MRTKEYTILVGEEDVTILEYQEEEYLNMSNAYKYVGWSKPTVDQRILREYRAGNIQRYKMPGKSGYYVRRTDLDHLKQVMNQPEVVPPPPAKKRAKTEQLEQSS